MEKKEYIEMARRDARKMAMDIYLYLADRDDFHEAFRQAMPAMLDFSWRRSTSPDYRDGFADELARIDRGDEDAELEMATQAVGWLRWSLGE
jgi:hypothetical protein